MATSKRRKVKRITPEERRERGRRIDADWKRHRNPADFQQELVYKWQHESLHMGNACDWTLIECERFIAYVWHSYFGTRATPPKLDAGRGKLSASANRWEITLPVWARNRNTILHELAHSLLDACGYTAALHGPQFVRMQIELFVAFSTFSRTPLMQSARAMGVKVGRRERVPRRRSCEKTLQECLTKHYHSSGNDYADWMRGSSSRSRFWAKVNKRSGLFGPDGKECWVWTASVFSNGYGQFWDGTYLPSGQPRLVKAHVFSFGVVPKGKELDHLCRNRACVRPSHLEAVTHGENMTRAVFANSRKTHCRRGHPYDEVNTYINKGKRYCKTCIAANLKERRERKRREQR